MYRFLSKVILMNVVRVDIDMHLISTQRGSGKNMSGPLGVGLNRPSTERKVIYTFKNSKAIARIL